MRVNHRALFWDFDQTLAYRPGMWGGALLSVLRDADPSTRVTREDLGPFVRQGFPWHTPEIPHPELNEPTDWWNHLERIFTRAFVGVGLPNELACQLASRVKAQYLTPGGWVVFDDTRPALTACHERGWRQCILSNHVPELPDLVGVLGLADFFEDVISSANVGYEKPRPEIFNLARSSAHHPPVAWMVGDSLEADVLGAERAGLRGILVRGKDSRARHCSPDLKGVLGIVDPDPPG